eukprot:6201679-Pleurochrysis_carterae.AAC.2
MQDTVKADGIPMTEDEFQGLGEGVQYSQGKLTKGGTWGEGTERQALAMILKAAEIIQQSDYETIRVLYDDTIKHYEYFDRGVGEKGTLEELTQNREREVQERGKRTERDRGE